MQNPILTNISKEFLNVTLAGTGVGNFLPGYNQLFNKVTLKTVDIFFLIDHCSPFLDTPPIFEWVHLCVTVIPCLLFCFIISLAITSSSLAFKYATFILKRKKMEVSVNEFENLKEEVYYQLTILNLQKSITLIKTLFFLEIINPLNWDRYMFLFSGFFISTPIISFFITVLLAITWLGLKIVLQLVFRLRIMAPDMPIILLFMIFFLMIMLYSNNYTTLYLGIEGTALATCVGLVLIFTNKKNLNYIKTSISFNFNHIQNFFVVKYSQLVDFWKEQKQLTQEAVAAGMLYFLLNIFVTIVLGYLFFFFLLNFNTLSYFTISFLFLTLTHANFEIGVVLVLFLTVFCFKLGITPFHFWLPGVFSGANYGIFFFLAIPVKIVFSYLLFKFFFTFFQSFFFLWGPFFILLGLLSIFIGSLGLYYETQIKRFFAYSTINHFGNMFLAFGMGNFIGQNAFFIYFFAYILMNLVFIHFVSTLINTVTQKTISSFSEINSIQFTNSYSQLGFAFTLLSMIGLPPFVGFWGKMVVLESLLNMPLIFGIILIIFLIGTSVLASSSYLGVIKTLIITSFKNHQLSFFFPFSSFSLKNLIFLMLILSFSFLLLLIPSFWKSLDVLIIFILNSNYFFF